MLLKFQPNFIKFPRNSIYATVSLRVHRVLCETCSFKELFYSLPIVGLLTKDKEIESFDQNPQNPLIESFLESTMVNDIGMWRKSYDFNDVAEKHACFHFQL